MKLFKICFGIVRLLFVKGIPSNNCNHASEKKHMLYVDNN